MQHGVVFNIQKYSIHDGPGIRTTVFLKGCPLSCWWCHNPESRTPEPEIHTNETRCVRCGQCVQACPQGRDEGARDGSETAECLRCGACVQACPTEARRMVGRRMSVDAVMTSVLQDRIFYDDSGGGVTFSGGEPLMQPEFLAGLLRRCRQEGLHTAVDTCGFAPQDQLLSVANLTDLVLYDLKTVDERLHEDSTGMSNRLILENLQALGRVHDRMWIRIPILPGYNDDKRQWEAAARLIVQLPGVTQVNLLPYHNLHRHKLAAAGNTASANGSPRHHQQMPTPSAEHLEKLAEIFRAQGLYTKIGG
jgi:pyruvate formate lyase activating enzyme